jgi:hypothetical protein
VVGLCRKCSEEDDKIIRAMDEGQSPELENRDIWDRILQSSYLSDTNCYRESREASSSSEIFLVD